MARSRASEGDDACPRRLALSILGRSAWLWIALLFLPVLVAIYGHPPATDHPLPDGALRTASGPLLAKAGVAGTPIFIRPGGGACAWGTVAGLGHRERIVLSPGTLNYPLDEALWTVAHEAGHVRRGDPLLGVIVGWAWIAIMLGAAQTATAMAWRRFRWIGLAALPISVAVVWGIGLPAFNFIQRQVERRADRFGVGVAGSGASAAAMILRSNACLGVRDKASFLEVLYASNHAQTQERVASLRAMDRR